MFFFMIVDRFITVNKILIEVAYISHQISNPPPLSHQNCAFGRHTGDKCDDHNVVASSLPFDWVRESIYHVSSRAQQTATSNFVLEWPNFSFRSTFLHSTVPFFVKYESENYLNYATVIYHIVANYE